VVQRVLSGEPRLLIGGVDAILTSACSGSKGLPSSCVGAYNRCLSCGAFSWVPVNGEAPGGHLCGPAGVYMISCRARESARGRGQVNIGAYIRDNAYARSCTSIFFSDHNDIITYN